MLRFIQSLLLLVCCVALASACSAAVIYVNCNAPGGGNGQSWATAYNNLQFGLAAAHSGDEIWIAAGTYKPTTGWDRRMCFVMKESVALYGGFPSSGDPTWESRDWVANETILSGDIGTAGSASDNSYHVVVGANNATLEGFTLTAGNANGSSETERSGGGMYNSSSSPTVTNCTFTGNSASGWPSYGGAGMYNSSGSPTVTNCTFTSNSAGYYGGGMYNSSGSATLTNCVFSGNSAQGDGYGGGMENWGGTVTSCTFTGNSGYSGGGMYNSGGTVTNCTFTGNSASYHNGGGMVNFGTVTNCTFTSNSASRSGGGMYNASSSNPTVTDCTFTRNTASTYGGGMENTSGSSPTVTNCRFYANWAAIGGGGMDNESSSPTLTNCVFVGNGTSGSGGAVYNYLSDNSSIVNSVLVDNAADEYAGGGIFNLLCTPTVTNCLVGENIAPFDPQISGDAVVTYTDVQGGLPGVGNIDANPLFLRSPSPGTDGIWGTDDDDYGDLQLQQGSLCIDAGINSGIPAGILTDMLGNLRIWDGNGDALAVVDMGAYEYGAPPVPTVTLAEAKLLPDGVILCVDGAVVSAKWNDFLYMEADDRSSGIRVDKTAHGLSDKIRVNVEGTIRTNADGERYIQAASLAPAGSKSVAPVLLVNRSLGGGDCNYDEGTGAGQRGVKGGSGLNNIGLFVCTTGRVTYSEYYSFFYLDDGSALDDGSGYRGVKVVMPSYVYAGQHVRVVGTSSCYKVGDDLFPMVRATQVVVVQ